MFYREAEFPIDIGKLINLVVYTVFIENESVQLVGTSHHDWAETRANILLNFLKSEDGFFR